MCEILLLNCQSLTNDKVNFITSEYLCGSSRVGILCLTETNLSNESIEYIHFPDFTRVSSFNRTQHKSGGVGIWVTDTLKVHPLNLNTFCIEKHFEVCGMSLRVGCDKTVVVLLCYRSPRLGDVNIFCDRLSGVLNRVYKPNIDIILLGDFNLDPDRDLRDFSKLLDVVQGYDLMFIVDQPTRGKYILDNVCTSEKLNYVIKESHISDHRCVLVKAFECDFGDGEKSIGYGRDFHPKKIKLFYESLLKESWHNVCSRNTVVLYYKL